MDLSESGRFPSQALRLAQWAMKQAYSRRNMLESFSNLFNTILGSQRPFLDFELLETWDEALNAWSDAAAKPQNPTLSAAV